MGNSLHSFSLGAHGARSHSADCAAQVPSDVLHRLSDEVGRIASTLARLADRPAGLDQTGMQRLSHALQLVPLEVVTREIKARRLRSRHFDSELFADPAWDMLLELFRAELAQHRVSVSSLCNAAGVPTTTALRWIKSMSDADLFRRHIDSVDRRRTFVRLSPRASDAMRNYFNSVATLSIEIGKGGSEKQADIG